MANPPKAKGTGGETELLRALRDRGITVQRTSAGKTFDLQRLGEAPVIQALATRPDYGQWLVTMRLDDFALLLPNPCGLEIEVKRYKRFSHHGIFESKFGGKT